MKDLEAEVAELREGYDSMKASLESETLSKVDLQNHIQSLKEEMAFRQKVHDEVRILLFTMFLLKHTLLCTIIASCTKFSCLSSLFYILMSVLLVIY